MPKALGVDAAVQLAAFVNAAADPWEEARDAAMTELLYSSGLRVSELAHLDVQAGCWAGLAGSAGGFGACDRQRRQAPQRARGGHPPKLRCNAGWRCVPAGLACSGPSLRCLWACAVRALRRRWCWLRLRQRSQQAGLPVAVHPHVLRHSFASHVLQSSGDLRAVQELLGHANISTTQIYTRLDFQHLAQAYEQAHPRARKKS